MVSSFLASEDHNSDRLRFRILNPNDASSLFELISTKDRVWRNHHIERTNLNLENLNLNLQNRNLCYVGCYELDKMIGCLSGYKWTSLPYYTVENLYIRSSQKSPVTFKKNLDGMLSLLVTQMEKDERFTFFAITALDYVPKSVLHNENEQSNFGEFVQALKGYRFCTEAIIPANTLPKFETYKRIMGGRTWNVNLVIRRVYKKL